MLFVSACFLGYADSAFNTMLYSLYGSYYETQSESAFAAFKLIQATSTAIAFFYSPYLTYPFIVLITAFFLFLGLECLIFLDVYVNKIEDPVAASLLRDGNSWQELKKAGNSIHEYDSEAAAVSDAFDDAF